jgi:hypothetical protein
MALFTILQPDLTLLIRQRQNGNSPLWHQPIKPKPATESPDEGGLGVDSGAIGT